MTVTFDFLGTGTSRSLTFTATGQTATDTDNGVVFTISAQAVSGNSYVYFGEATQSTSPLYMSVYENTDSGDAFRISFASTANPSLQRLFGTAGDPLSIQLGTGVQFGGNWRITFTNPSGPDFVTTIATGGTITATPGSYGGIVFTSLGGAQYSYLQINGISAAGVNCFCAGTRIATPDGPVAVENLREGMMVSTADGTASRVRWVGATRIEPGQGDRPVRIGRGALGDGLPERDLCLSPDHALAIDGMLVNAAALVNGRTIRRDPANGPVNYYHIETGAHELVLAEGLAAETFLEHLAPQDFANERTRKTRVVPEMGLPRIRSARLLPPALRARLASGIAEPQNA